MKTILFGVCWWVAFTNCVAVGGETRLPRVGETPPPIGLERILQAPGQPLPTWQTLKGKVVVLEFWATWCGPCIAAIPHLNSVADHFEGKAVQFIAITDEDEKVVEPFLKKKPMHAWVGLDTDRSMFKAYGVEGIPLTVVVDEKGTIAAVTYPSTLTEAHLEELLSGKKLSLPESNSGKDDGLWPGELPGSAKGGSLFQVLVKPSETEYARSASEGGKISMLGTRVKDALSSCYRIPSVRVVANCQLPEGAYDFVIKTPAKNQETANDWLRRAVESAFELSTRKETRELDVYVLAQVSGGTPRLAPTVSTGGSSSSSSPGRIQAVRGTLKSLAWSLESVLNKPVLDETKLTNYFDFELSWDAKKGEEANPEKMIRVLREQLGLELSRARREVELLIIEKAKKEMEETKTP